MAKSFQHAHGVEFARGLLGTKRHARVNAEEMQRLETELASLSLSDVLDMFPADRVLSNFVLNIWEWAHGRTTLQSLPWNVSLPISDVCNARCSFCTSWLDGRQQITLEQLDTFEPVLRTAVYVGLIGHGEPLSHPRLGEITDRLEVYLDPRATLYTITNGIYLARWLDRLDRLNLSSISCSLNAATSETHHEVMGLPPGEFPRIVESLRAVASGRATSRPVSVSVTLVVTRQNLHEIPAFIELGNDIKATSIYLRTLLPQSSLIQGLNYHLLPPYLHPDFDALRTDAVAAMKASSVPVHAEPATWSNPIFPEVLAKQIEVAAPALITRADAMRDKEARVDRTIYYLSAERKLRGAPSADPWLADNLDDGSNPLERHAPFRCRAVYNNLYVNELFLRMSPCCYLTRTPGHDEVRIMDVGNLTDAWNAPSLRDLRHHLANGPLYGACRRCPESW